MINNKFVITATSFAIMFFLTSFGIQLPFHGNFSKPRPRTRAIPNLLVKSTSSSTASTKSDFAPSGDIQLESFELKKPLLVLSGISAADFSNPVSSCNIRPLQGRSPPSC
jgi:hypothetical protein